MSKYSERLKYYKKEPERQFQYSGSGCFFHNIEEFKNFQDVDDDAPKEPLIL